MDVNQFLSSLTNLEKTRDFNLFKSYSLKSFQLVLANFGLEKKTDTTLRISVVGTNGKGSIAHFLSQIAFRSETFSKVGLYTSPHLLTQNERIKFNGNPISDTWMDTMLNSFSTQELEQLKALSYFEFFTFMAILYFKDNACNLEVYEAGLGGRLDATKLTLPDYIILTKIALEHTEILGDTEEKILLEKLQIVTNTTRRIYTFLQEENLMEVTKSFCEERGIDLIVYPCKPDRDYLSFNKEFALFTANHILEKQNLSTIMESIFNIIPDVEGRMQVLRKDPILLFDIGHNPSAVYYLLISLHFAYPNERNWTIYFGCLKDKDAKKILEVLIKETIVEKIFQIVGENWNQESIIHPKVESISEEQFIHSLTISKNAGLIIGSFRLYPLVKKIGF